MISGVYIYYTCWTKVLDAFLLFFQIFTMDEEGKFPKRLKKGVLSEDGIYNMLEVERFK